MLYHTIPYYILCYAMLCYAILYYTILCHIISYYIILYHIMSYYIILYYITLYYIILYYSILCYTQGEARVRPGGQEGLAPGPRGGRRRLRDEGDSGANGIRIHLSMRATVAWPTVAPIAKRRWSLLLLPASWSSFSKLRPAKSLMTRETHHSSGKHDT